MKTRTAEQEQKNQSSSSSSDSSNRDDSFVRPPEISLPKGRGAIRGIDEKFQFNLTNGSKSQPFPMYVSFDLMNFERTNFGLVECVIFTKLSKDKMCRNVILSGLVNLGSMGESFSSCSD